MKLHSFTPAANPNTKDLKPSDWGLTFAHKYVDGAWVRYGRADSGAAVLNQLYIGSNLHSSCLNFIQQIIKNAVYQITDADGNDIELLPSDKAAFTKWKQAAARAISVYGYCGAVVQTSVTGGVKTYDVQPKDGQQVRVDSDSSFDIFPALYFSDNFADKNEYHILTIAQYLALSADKMRRDKKVVKLPNILDPNNTNELYRGYYVGLDDILYSSPLYFSFAALNAILTEIEMAHGAANQAQNRFTGGGVLNVVRDNYPDDCAGNGETYQQAVDRLDDDIQSEVKKKLTGDVNSGNTFISIDPLNLDNEGKQITVERYRYTPFPNTFDKERFNTYEDWAAKNIYLANGVNPVLLQPQTQGGGISNDKNATILTALRLLIFSVIANITDVIAELPTFILKERGIDATIKTNIVDIVNTPLSEDMLYKLLPDDLLRAMFGLPELDATQIDAVAAKAAQLNNTGAMPAK